MQYYEKQAIHYSAIKQFLKTDAIWSHCLGCGTLLPMTTQTLIFNSLYSNVKACSRKHSLIAYGKLTKILTSWTEKNLYIK